MIPALAATALLFEDPLQGMAAMPLTRTNRVAVENFIFQVVKVRLKVSSVTSLSRVDDISEMLNPEEILHSKGSGQRVFIVVHSSVTYEIEFFLVVKFLRSSPFGADKICSLFLLFTTSNEVERILKVTAVCHNAIVLSFHHINVTITEEKQPVLRDTTAPRNVTNRR